MRVHAGSAIDQVKREKRKEMEAERRRRGTEKGKICKMK
jgi:hypothetical protein